MATTYEDAPDRSNGATENASPGNSPRVRRFAPRRSRSAQLQAETAQAPVQEQSAAPDHPAAPGAPVEGQAPSEPSASHAGDQAASATDQAPPALPEIAPAPAGADTTTRRPRARRSTRATKDAAPAPAVTPEEPAAQAAEVAETAPAAVAAESAAPVVPAAEPPTRGRARRRTRPAAEAPAPAIAEPDSPVVEAATAAPTPEGAAEIVAPAIETSAETPPAAGTARPRRTRSRKPATPKAGAPEREAAALRQEHEQGTPEGAEALPTAAPERPDALAAAAFQEPATSIAEPAASYGPQPGPLPIDTEAGQAASSQPGGSAAALHEQPARHDADATAREEILARALREMFPAPGERDEEGAGTAEPLAAQAAEPEPSDESAEESDEGDLAEGATSEAARRRGRRGRRGGRGRRRNGISLVAVGEEAPPAESGNGAAEKPADDQPLTLPPVEPPLSLFVPESPPRKERSWRERGPRRQWGRTFSREERVVQMPPPKPSNGFRPGPIPQALPPAAAAEAPEIEIPPMPMFTMPDLRIDEPLRPGETRTERLLEAQTHLLQAMLEQQSRQIEMLTATVSGLRQTVQHLSATRVQLPRTAIFVDAPNVCYAAENARVNLDFGRMLKYLSRDRQLVHALSYAPITDDVREGIRYETQRFVAPFLRSGYKLVTKPLKRFPDGSAKGNFDIELAIDIVTMSERLDIVVLVSGDSDFERMIELIQSKGVRVEVVAFASNVSTELVNVADVFIDINQHLEHMRAL